MLDGRNDPGHPIRRVLEDCDQELPEESRFNPWSYYESSHQSGKYHSARLYSESTGIDDGISLNVRCSFSIDELYQSRVSALVEFGYSVELPGDDENKVKVYWSIDGGPMTSEHWHLWLYSTSRLSFPNSGVVEFAQTLVTSSEFWIEATDADGGETFFAVFRLGGRDDPEAWIWGFAAVAMGAVMTAGAVAALARGRG